MCRTKSFDPSEKLDCSQGPPVRWHENGKEGPGNYFFSQRTGWHKLNDPEGRHHLSCVCVGVTL